MTYPNDLDELSAGVPSDVAAPNTDLGDTVYPHDDHHRALATGLEAVQTELGLNPAGAELTVDARIQAIEDSTSVIEGVPTVINAVTEHGATGDGVTDDMPAIQNALDACSAAGGGIVYLPAGTYLIGTAASTGTFLTVPSLVTLRGAGPKASVILSASTQVNQHPLWFDTGGSYARIEQLGVTAVAPTTGGGSAAMTFKTNQHCWISDCWISADFAWGVFIWDGSENCGVSRVTVDGTTNSHSIEFNGSSYCTVEDCDLSSSAVPNATIECWADALGRATGNKIINNRLRTAGGTGIICAADVGTVISGNHIISPTGAGIYLGFSDFDSITGSREAVVTNNFIYGAGDGGVVVSGRARECTITGNVIQAATGTGAGILVDGLNCTVTANVCYLNGGHGIHVNTAGDRTNVVGNICMDNSGTGVNQRDGIRIEGDYCRVIGNTASDTRGGSARQSIGLSILGSYASVIGNTNTGNVFLNFYVAIGSASTVQLANENGTDHTNSLTATGDFRIDGSAGRFIWGHADHATTVTNPIAGTPPLYLKVKGPGDFDYVLPAWSAVPDMGLVTVTDVAGTSDTIATADAGKTLRYTNSGLVTVTLPVAVGVGTTVDLIFWGAAGGAIQDDGSSTVHAEGTVPQYGKVSCVVVDIGVWSAVGDVS